MPFVQNPYIRAGFDNLAKMFAPPSGQEAAAWAMANGRNAEAKRAEDVYAHLTDPNSSREVVDRYYVANGGRPDQTFQALDMGDATTRRNHDMESADRRYSTDMTARTTLQTNAADNERALGETRLKSLAGWFGPVAQDAVRPAVPSEIAALYGAPGALPEVEGNRSPMSETQWKAAQMERLRQSGELPDEDLTDMVMSEKAPVEAIGPDGRTPMYMSPGRAVRTGAQPAPRSPLVAVNTGPGGDGKLREKLDESEGKRLSDLQAAAVTSAGLRQDLDLMRQLIEEAPQGPLVGRLAAAFPGFSDAGTAFQSIVERAAPGLRVEGSGATSDIEFRGMLNSLPRLQNRPQANRLIAEMMRAKADVNVRRGEIVTAYQNGNLDAAQMRQRLADVNRQSILSPGLKAMIDAVGGGAEPLSPNSAPAAAPSPGSIVDGFRFRGGDPSSPDSWEQL